MIAKSSFFAIASMLTLFAAQSVNASSFYTVTDLEPDGVLHYPLDYYFSKPSPGMNYNSFTPDQQALMPTVDAISANYPATPVNFRMIPLYSNNLGTVIGKVPFTDVLDSYAHDEWELGYSRMQPDGHYGAFVPLTYTNMWDASSTYHGLGGGASFIPGYATIDAKNRILISNGLGNQILDLETGISTNLNTLLPPGVFRYGVGNAQMGGDGSITCYGSVDTPRGNENHSFLLTPATPTPEPSTLTMLEIGIIGLAILRSRQRIATPC